jgi:hypothetical protein
MRGTDNPLFNRVLSIDDIEQLDKPTNAMKKAISPDAMLSSIGEGEAIIDTDNNRVLTKLGGKFYKQVIDGTDIKLEEV